MPYYPFICNTCGETYTFKRHYDAASLPAMCAKCEEPLERVYTVPMMAVPEMNAADVMNRHIRGEGEPVAGLSQAQTVAAAKAIANSKHGWKAGVHPQRSYPGQPARNYYGKE